jgi:hypothetical protein
MISGDTLFDIHEALVKQSVNLALKDLESATNESQNDKADAKNAAKKKK